MHYLDKAKALCQHFGVYANGHFNITIHDIAHLLMLMDESDPEAKLEEFYREILRRYGED